MASCRAVYKQPVAFAKRPGPPRPTPCEEPREVLLALRETATKENVPWSLDDDASTIRVSIAHYRDVQAGTHKRLPKFFDPLASSPTESKPSMPMSAVLDAEAAAAAAKKKMADPAARLHASPIYMGLPFSMTAVTTNKKEEALVEASRSNVRLMGKLKMIDESAQRLQAMLREETASVPGQQIPDKAHKAARDKQKAEWDALILEAATKDHSPKRPRSRSALSGVSTNRS
mmetsp:Transcript_1988/g.4602  ORF Transcript_1988/g.4602 Transcript_1988/m.4602 type:complete len:231 (-) Transcript_1988:781-1473(-)|eukprot:CAMPEP_0179003476 /NCGR_PEP_ID=MMETSP0795-20121207/12712_1 /TAXON_ID=88552 /ORGANISM="Amoebophrya sp., Strain Ameob2" /LENGTH=230 /DNA_ID=CAMNT_0020697515 /DNA_START=102 /DNA_END=794 /DNA_ORIENTATION=+